MRSRDELIEALVIQLAGRTSQRNIVVEATDLADAILAARSKQPEAEPVEVDEEREKADARVACPYPEFSPERWQFIQGWLACAKARRS